MSPSRHSATAEFDPISESALSSPAPGLPRLLEAVPAHGAMSLQTHLDTHGELPGAPRRRNRAGVSRLGDRRGGTTALIDQIEQAGLGGRGGAGFPMAKKMRAVAAGRGKPIVVVNATEGEPASLKDRTLLQTLPHLVLDGAALAARAIGAEGAIVCVCESSSVSAERLAAAIAEREHLPGRWPRIVLNIAPQGYVAGQESALVNHLNGGPGKPTFTPPMPFERGVRRQPTLVNNAETVAHLALIARHGPHWFRELGVPDQPGSTLVTLSGPLAYPGVYEVEYGASLASLLDAAGGATKLVRAALFGGYAGTWVDAASLPRLALANVHLAPYRASIGAGVVLLLSAEACPVAETARVTRWLAEESAGQCGPCVHGLDALARTLEQIRQGSAQGDAMSRVEQLSMLVGKRGACAHPDGTARFVMSASEVFTEEMADHARYGPCDACARRAELPLPRRQMKPAGELIS
ncbi:MAG TPA: NADH-ubiquinone oxidoreductase-F iron-sulfur binding region domain-containing protein [Solirubrobacteraceae bacterium]|jgi:NADH:ubiquinone oxidoreductase subunit F (NADH-binding)|nr:NADH-ubiquinone oxidoreductase-F iron-sulfur binding region domain-containing protein [Solirubrobacteraceae bacterium]